MPDPVPFRIELMGDPPHPYIVHDGGDRSRPFDRHAMRSAYVGAEYRAEVVALWEAYQRALGDLTLAEAQVGVLRAGVADLKAERDALREQPTAAPEPAAPEGRRRK